MKQTKTDKETFQLICQRKKNGLNKVPKMFHELISFMESNIGQQFQSFSLFVVCGGAHKSRFLIQKNFKKAFATLSLKQKLDLFQKAVQFGLKVFNDQRKSKQMIQKQNEAELNNILSSGQLSFYITIHQGFRSSRQIHIKIEKLKISAKDDFAINLQNYILRRSKRKHPQCYVLEAINRTQPEHIKFSFANIDEQDQHIPMIQKLSDLAFKVNITGMLLPENTQKLNYKPQYDVMSRQSVGRLSNPQNSNKKQAQILNTNSFNNTQVNAKGVLQYSKQLAGKIKQSDPSKTNDQIIKQLLNSKKNNQDPQTTQFTSIQNQNIYNKVLQIQSDVKQPVSSPYQKSVQSPIHRFTYSEVKSIQEPSFKNKVLRQKNKNVFELMLPEFNLRDFEASMNSKNFKQIYLNTVNEKLFTIYQHHQKKQRFKCSLVVSAQVQKVYSVLINEELLKKWNSQVDESQIKITLSTENCLICYQKHKRYSTWFKERDYLFMRHAFVYKECKYIADRSIEHSSFIPFQSIQRGYIRHAVTRLKQLNQKQTEVIFDFSIDHGGYLGAEKKKQLNLTYLKEFEKLNDFITNPKNQTLFKTNYCSLDWNIDWIDDQNQGSFPHSLSFKTQQFNQGSQIDFSIGRSTENVQLDSDQFYSVKDEQDIQRQHKEQQFDFQTTQNYKAFNNKNVQIGKTLSQLAFDQEEGKKQIQQEQAKSYYEQPSIIDPGVVLNDQGYCILPQIYIKKRHFQRPKDNVIEERIRKYDNIVLKDDFVQQKQDGIRLVNKKKIDAQNNVINYIIKTMKKNLFGGKSILNISLPVQIFKEDSNTQRLCQSMSLGPYFLQRAAKQKNIIERLKLSVCFALSNSIMYFYIQKPFNPILGQTYQGVINGCPIYAEQISHHPPITSIYFVGRGYKVYANLQAKVYLHLNSGDGVNYGFYTIEFDDGHKIKFQTSPGQVSGFTIGERKYKFKDRLYVFDPDNYFYTELLFEDPKAGFFSKGKWIYTDQMQGQILKVTPNFLSKFLQSEQKIHPKPKQIEKVISKMQGRWIYQLKFDGVTYYNIAHDDPYTMKNYEYPLNSDARYRQDLIYRTKNDLAKSQIHKQYLENIQRKDRKLRQQYHGKTH